MVHHALVASDVHFDEHHRALWANFVAAENELRPEVVVLSGDVVDLGMLSKYPQGADDPAFASLQIKYAIEQINRLSAPRVLLMYGNHEDRWAKAVYGDRARELAGTKGLTLEDQFRALGAPKRMVWVNESKDVPGIFLGRKAILIRHGHRKGPVVCRNVAQALQREFASISAAQGHHHRGQMLTRTELDHTRFFIALPHMSGYHEYAGGNPDWQRGFLHLAFYGASRLRDCTRFTPNLVIADESGSFVFNGKLYT